MSNGESPSRSASKDLSPSEAGHSSSGHQPGALGPPSLPLTAENVKKLQENYPLPTSAFARQSVEAFIKQSNFFLNKDETSRDGNKEQPLPHEKELGVTSVPHREDTSEHYSENVEDITKTDFQTRSPLSSVFEAQTIKTKCEVADLETQTEWSYSDTSEQTKMKQKSLSEKEKTEFGDSGERISHSARKERRGKAAMGSKEVQSSEEMVHLEAKALLEPLAHSHSHLPGQDCCEFCTTLLRPIPTAEELDETPEAMDSFLCCRTYKEVFQYVVQELIANSSQESEIDITPHRHASQTLMESRTKKILMEEIQDRGFENYREVFEQYMRFGTCCKIKFKLSEHPPKPKKVAPKKRRPQPKEVLVIDEGFQAEQLKICHPSLPVKKYYPDGKIFLLLFPDGTGQIYYPSGNVAILITYVKETQYTYMVLKDSTSHRIQAFFTNQGYAVCYHDNGIIRVCLDLCFGSYFKKNGIRHKYWNWWDTSCHVHAPPFQPISVELNSYIQVNIQSQDQIFLTFTKDHEYFQVNVGAKLKVKDPSMLEFLKSSEDTEELISLLKDKEIKRLLANLKELLKKMCRKSPNPEELYLIISKLKETMRQRSKVKLQAQKRK